jgi:hypothetical protein
VGRTRLIAFWVESFKRRLAFEAESLTLKGVLHIEPRLYAQPETIAITRLRSANNDRQEVSK